MDLGCPSELSATRRASPWIVLSTLTRGFLCCQNSRRIFDDTFDITLNQITFSAIFLLVAKQSLGTFATINRHGSKRIYNWPSLRFCTQQYSGMRICAMLDFMHYRGQERTLGKPYHKACHLTIKHHNRCQTKTINRCQFHFQHVFLSSIVCFSIRGI